MKVVGYILTALLILLLIFVFYKHQIGVNTPPHGSFSLLPQQTINTNNTNENSSTTPPTTTPVSTTTLQGYAGNTLIVKDFLDASTTIPFPGNPGYYFLSGGVEELKTYTVPPYIITYVRPNMFYIALLQEPLSQTRQIAEQDLMEKLGLSQSDMCKLNYQVFVPLRTNPIYANQNLGFSFCSGAVPIPLN